jgi:glycosyltransferase involved in cell wall biosynthesis
VKTVSVVIPVKNGERYLQELLAALQAEAVTEILVIDSGSCDRSVEIARDAGVDVIEISPGSFAHGRTRNLGAARTSGELICYLTQDATPVPGWLNAYREAMELAPDVGAAFGPHLARRDTSPMIARELEEFFAMFTCEGRPALQRQGDPTYLSNVNACYARACWEDVRFRDVGYAEDQGFGVDMLAAGWCKVYHPGAAVLHAHDFGWGAFMRRYFDEYRGLRETIGHIEPFGLRQAAGHTVRSVRLDMRWLRRRGALDRDLAQWAVRSAMHHGGRRAFSALGSRADRLPPIVQRRMSLERRAGDVDRPAETEIAFLTNGSPIERGVEVEPTFDREMYAAAEEVWRDGPAPLLEPLRGMADRDRLRIAMVIPAFGRASGGHSLLFEILSRLEGRGHICSVWVHEYAPHFGRKRPGVIRHDINEFFAPISAPVFNGFRDWHGADMVMSTAWQTVHPALLLENCYQRVYIVNDHEPEFHATSVESVLAADTYRHGLPCIAGSPWLRDLLVERYGADSQVFEYGVNHDVYRPRPVPRRKDTVVYYARHETPRRAVPIGLMALAELHRRRPNVRIALFGSADPIQTSFPYRHLGVVTPEGLSWLYSEATAGLSLSLTNFSLTPKEMMACGLPCVELAGASAESIFGSAGPLELAPLDPIAIADALERLLDNRERWEQCSRSGLEHVAEHTWDKATEEVERGLRRALRLREETFDDARARS